jgi:hydroxymethylpyrimidine pyrophosphatase-like HAD family hydrolase
MVESTAAHPTDAGDRVTTIVRRADAGAECDMRTGRADQVTASRSQPYYLDTTHPIANKGDALSELAKLLTTPLAEIAVIGDDGNDVAMFERSGVCIAMGNAGPQVQHAAVFVTESNREDGFGNAIERFILSQGRSNARAERAPAGGDRA